MRPADDQGTRSEISRYLPLLLQALLHDQSYAEHLSWLAAHTSCQQAAVGVLLRWCLPVVAAGLRHEAPASVATLDSAAEQLDQLTDIVLHTSLASAAYHLQGDDALAAVQAAAVVVEALPASCPAGMEPDLFAELFANAAVLLGACCRGVGP